MLIPDSAIAKTGSFLKGSELVKKDAMLPDFIGEILNFEITTGSKYKEVGSDKPEEQETKYRLTMNVTTLGEKQLDLNKTNLETLVTKYGTKVSNGYDLDKANLIGKLIILQAKLENNKKYSTLVIVSDMLNNSPVSTTPLAQIKPIVAQQVAPIANTANLDNEIVSLLDELAFIADFPIMHNGTPIGDKRKELPTKSLQWKQTYVKMLSEIKAELLSEMSVSNNATDNDFS